MPRDSPRATCRCRPGASRGRSLHGRQARSGQGTRAPGGGRARHPQRRRPRRRRLALARHLAAVAGDERGHRGPSHRLRHADLHGRTAPAASCGRPWGRTRTSRFLPFSDVEQSVREDLAALRSNPAAPARPCRSAASCPTSGQDACKQSTERSSPPRDGKREDTLRRSGAGPRARYHRVAPSTASARKPDVAPPRQLAPVRWCWSARALPDRHGAPPAERRTAAAGPELAGPLRSSPCSSRTGS